MHEIEPLLVWTIAGAVALLTPILGYFSPFGRVRRQMVADLQGEIDDLTRKLDGLKTEVGALTEKIQDCELERGRLERENYRLYRELDGRDRK